MLKFEGSNGKSCEFDRESVRASEVLEALGLQKKAIAAKLDGAAVDLNREIRAGGRVEPLTAADEEGLDVLRHSCAHLMAQAIERLYPGTHFGIGPCIKDGSYYDMDATQLEIGRASCRERV